MFQAFLPFWESGLEVVFRKRVEDNLRQAIDFNIGVKTATLATFQSWGEHWLLWMPNLVKTVDVETTQCIYEKLTSVKCTGNAAMSLRRTQAWRLLDRTHTICRQHKQWHRLSCNDPHVKAKDIFETFRNLCSWWIIEINHRLPLAFTHIWSLCDTRNVAHDLLTRCHNSTNAWLMCL